METNEFLKSAIILHFFLKVEWKNEHQGSTKLAFIYQKNRHPSDSTPPPPHSLLKFDYFDFKHFENSIQNIVE